MENNKEETVEKVSPREILEVLNNPDRARDMGSLRMLNSFGRPCRFCIASIK